VLQARDTFPRGSRVIARTPRGLEVGEVLCEATDEVVSKMGDAPIGSIQRQVTEQDKSEISKILAASRDEFQKCREIVRELNLPMDLVDVEHLFGGERVVIYYLAEDRIDFRDLVKRLANEFQTRIEMRQIGVRDEAKLLADYGDCGKPVCCNTHLAQMPPVSMKMAKLQKATLDPTKISGRCGRLKCCLRYEYDTYEEIRRELPPVGSDVVTREGRMRVVGQEILSEHLLVVSEDNRRLMIAASEVLSVIRSGGKKDKARADDDDVQLDAERGGE
jgi:cell fate regulator YaaT (PSP1 superfamily)